MLLLMIAHDLRVPLNECIVIKYHGRNQREIGPPSENCIVTKRVTVTSNVKHQVDPAVTIVSPCTVLVLEAIDSCVFVGQTKSGIISPGQTVSMDCLSMDLVCLVASSTLSMSGLS